MPDFNGVTPWNRVILNYLSIDFTTLISYIIVISILLLIAFYII